MTSKACTDREWDKRITFICEALKQLQLLRKVTDDERNIGFNNYLERLG